MGRVNDDKWLEEALNKAIHSDETRPDFEKWKASHPEAVEMLTSRTPQMQRPPRIRRIIMNATLIKLAAAAVIAIAAIVGITQLIPNSPQGTQVAQETITGPTTHTFADGSTVQLAQGAGIRTFADAGKRGFEHLAGQIDVTVAKGKGEFIVASPYGQVKALGTRFTMNVMDEVAANTKERVQLLAVKVTEGKVEVRNQQGTTTLGANQDIVVALNAAPYDFNNDEKLPQELRTRVQSMINALKARDGAGWVANFNLPYLYKLAKGQVAYDPNLFGGCAEDAQNFRKGLGDKVGSPEELAKIVASTVNFSGGEVYITSLVLNKAGDHATARCVSKNGGTVVTSPQWHNFDGGWWQIDD